VHIAMQRPALHPTMAHALAAQERGQVYLHTALRLSSAGAAVGWMGAGQWHYVQAHAEFRRMEGHLAPLRLGR
jgi:hypothetical protein